MSEHITHTEYIRTVPDAKYAVMMVHGILATPNFWSDFVKLVPEDISIYNLLLDGHGGRVEDFSATSMDKWREQVHGVFDGLSERYEKIFLVGHSMGTLFSIQLAVGRPEKVAAVFLLASPLRIFVKPVAAKYSIKAVFDKIDESVPIERAAKNALSVSLDKRLWKYIPWAPRFIELFLEIRRTRPLIPKISVPTQVFQSANDELVSIKSAELFRHNENISVDILKDSSHQCYSDDDYRILLDSFKEIFKN
ncbi:MAG: alpha/beta fold hydrolase [Clostridia bacterium]|nr:alpha/beta fold hydrolase [Clostridia bacterium]